MNRIPMTSGDEYDVLGVKGSRRKVYSYLNRPGAASAIKRRYRRRERRMAQSEIAAQLAW